MPDTTSPIDSNHYARTANGGLRWIKFFAFLTLVAVSVGGGYVSVKWFQKRMESRELAALISALHRTSPGASPSAKSGLDVSVESVNKMVPDASFADLLKRPGSLREYKGSVLVVSLTSVDCPISKKLIPALVRLSAEFESRGVRFLIVNTDQDASQDSLESHAGVVPGWRYVDDKEAHIARALSAETTTETFVIDEAQTLRYRGCVDDRFEVGVNRPGSGSSYLRDAITAVLSQEPINTPVTPAPGCILGLPRSEVPSVPVTWHNQISRLVRYNCVECHRLGGNAPFSLESYERVMAKKAMIEEVLGNRTMPPWFADHAYGKWRNTRSLSDADRQMFSHWVSSGCIEGDSAETPVPLKRVTGWSIREPDIVIEAEPQAIPAEGFLEWAKFPVAVDIPNDLWVSEAEIRPSVPEVVHHAMLYIEYPPDDPRRLTQTEAESESSGGGNGFWLSYFPGRRALILPPGRAKLIPRHGKVFLQMHYVPNGKATVDKTRIGLKILPGPPEKIVVTSSVIKWDFRIPRNSTAEFVHSEVFGEDVRLLALMPHMHYRGSGAQVFLFHPDGRSETILNVPKFDPEWQFSYEFQNPLLVTKGTRIAIRHEYDNTAKNPRNPDPSIEVRHGNKTSNDMMINFFDWEPVGEDPPPSSKMKRRPFR